MGLDTTVSGDLSQILLVLVDWYVLLRTSGSTGKSCIVRTKVDRHETHPRFLRRGNGLWENLERLCRVVAAEPSIDNVQTANVVVCQCGSEQSATVFLSETLLGYAVSKEDELVHDRA